MSQAQIDEMFSNDKTIIANQKQLLRLEKQELTCMTRRTSKEPKPHLSALSDDLQALPVKFQKWPQIRSRTAGSARIGRKSFFEIINKVH